MRTTLDTELLRKMTMMIIFKLLCYHIIIILHDGVNSFIYAMRCDAMLMRTSMWSFSLSVCVYCNWHDNFRARYCDNIRPKYAYIYLYPYRYIFSVCVHVLYILYSIIIMIILMMLIQITKYPSYICTVYISMLWFSLDQTTDEAQRYCQRYYHYRAIVWASSDLGSLILLYFIHECP